MALHSSAGLASGKVRVGFAVVLSAVLVVLALAAPSDGARAAAMTSVSDTLSTSRPSLPSNHLIAFTLPNGVLAGQTITVTFPGTFDISSVLHSDIDFGSTTVQFNLGAVASGATWGAAVAGQTLTITSDSGTVASGTPLLIRIGTSTTHQVNGVNQIINPPGEGSYVISIGGTIPDSGETQVAIINAVTVTAAVRTSLQFSVSGVALGESVNGSPTTTSTTTTATSIPFGALVVNQSKVAAQDLSVTTNAPNGFVVTVQQDQNLRSSSGADINTFKNGSSTATPEAWTPPAANPYLSETFGHLGVTSEDDHNGNEFATDKWVGDFTTTSPRVIFSHTGAADGVTPDIGLTRVGYQIQISTLQEAGTDYTNTLTYVVTPSF